MKKNKVNLKTKAVALTSAVVLVLAIPIAGTLAWLSDETPAVTNTFTSAALFENPQEEFSLWEHKAVLQSNGSYELTADEVPTNTYGVLPGVNLPKDPTVEVANLQENAYLFLKVTGTLPQGMSYAIDDANWEALPGETNVYVYKGAPADATGKIISASETAKVSFNANIIKNQQIAVSNEYNGGSNTLAFEAYMIQADHNGTSAADAWANVH